MDLRGRVVHANQSIPNIRRLTVFLTMIDNRYIVNVVLRGIVALVFAYAVGMKIAEPWMTARDMASWAIIPDWAAGVLLPMVVAAESFVATGLLVGWGHRIFPAVGITLLLTFAVALAVEVGVSKKASCGCFGGTKLVVSDTVWISEGRNVAMVAMLVPSVLAPRRRAGWSEDHVEPE